MHDVEDPEERQILIERQMHVREWIKQNNEHWKKMTQDERHVAICSSTIRQDGSLKGRSCCSPVDLKRKLDYFISQVVCPSSFKYPFPIKSFVSAAMSFFSRSQLFCLSPSVVTHPVGLSGLCYSPCITTAAAGSTSAAACNRQRF